MLGKYENWTIDVFRLHELLNEELEDSLDLERYRVKYLDKKEGLRFIYGKTGRDILPFLLNMRSALRGSPGWTDNYCERYQQEPLGFSFNDGNDGWTSTLGNALWFLEQIIAACINSPHSKWHGD